MFQKIKKARVKKGSRPILKVKKENIKAKPKVLRKGVHIGATTAKPRRIPQTTAEHNNNPSMSPLQIKVKANNHLSRVNPTEEVKGGHKGISPAIIRVHMPMWLLKRAPRFRPRHNPIFNLHGLTNHPPILDL
jgi:hypothetical protein